MEPEEETESTVCEVEAGAGYEGPPEAVHCVSVITVPEQHELEKLNHPDSKPEKHTSPRPLFDFKNNNSSQTQLCHANKICFPCLAFRDCLEYLWKRWGDKIQLGFKFLLFASLIVYVGFAFNYEFGSEHSVRLLVMVVVVGLVVLLGRCGKSRSARMIVRMFCRRCLRPCLAFYCRYSHCLHVCMVAVVIALIIVFLIVDVALRRPHHLVSAAGIVVYVTIMFISSHQPRKCGFSDLVAMVVMCAALSSVAPGRRRDIMQVAIRALITGIVACLLTACMAGLVTHD